MSRHPGQSGIDGIAPGSAPWLRRFRPWLRIDANASHQGPKTMHRSHFPAPLAALLGLTLSLTVAARTPPVDDPDPLRAHPVVARMLAYLSADPGRWAASGEQLAAHWQPGYAPMLVEVATLAPAPAAASAALNLLGEQTGQDFGYDIHGWFEWLWNRDYPQHPAYGDFKAALYGLIDPRFAGYFGSDRETTIRLDEVRWGGVRQDGIPPLRQPTMIAAAKADYLDDDHIVFGIMVNGDARAYPKRILGWHEMVVDTVGGVPVAGVYCTLCGTMILYETTVDGVQHDLGTSGFLYRSNKLMYDRATQSLWNTLWGEPVIGPLVGRDISLPRRYLVTTRWGEWRRRHPDTRVLSLDTGYHRDYGEGVAYRDYFATDELMFNVPLLDQRLNNKDEVLGLVLPGHTDRPLAIASRYLQNRPLYHDRVGDVHFVVLTDRSGAHRVYRLDGERIRTWDQDRTVVDDAGTRWTLHEDALRSADGRELPRLPAQRAFWFGWFAAYTHTRLVH